MAVIDLTRSTSGVYYWETVTGSDTGAPLELPRGGAQVAIQYFGTFGDTLTLQASIDGTTWATLSTGPGGSAVTATAAGLVEVSTAARYIRPSAGASITDVDVWVSVVV